MAAKLSSVLFLPILLALLFISSTSSSISIPQVTSDNLYSWSYVPDNIHRFIILNQALLSEIKASLPSGNGIQYYSHDCAKNATLLRTCQNNRNVPILVVYNKVPIQYDLWVSGKEGGLKDDVLEWIDRIVKGGLRKNLDTDGIVKMLEEKGEVFVMVENKTVIELQMGYNILAKEFFYKDFIYLTDSTLFQALFLDIGQFIHIKNPHKSLTLTSEAFQKLLQDTESTTTFPKDSAALKYNYLRMFVLQNIWTRGFSKNVQKIQKERFQMKVRKVDEKGNYEQMRTVVVLGDLTRECLQFWQRLDRGIFEDKGNMPGSIFNRIFKRNDVLNNIDLIQVFFHIKLKERKLPYVLVIDGEDPSVPHLPLRYLKELSLSNENPYHQVKEFLNLIDEGKVSNTQLTSGIPKKNGFTGKGSEKNVQKLSFETYQQALLSARENKKYYLLFINAFDYKCSQCLTFYNELKKLASFLYAEDFTQAIFGVFDLSKDQINLKYLKNVPSLFLFTPYDSAPVEFNRRYEFEDVHKFLKEEIQKCKQKNRQRVQEL